MNPYLKQYQQTQVQTASPEKILIMLYDGAIQFLNKALVALDEKNTEESHNNIIGAQKIISEFMNTLDMDVGGDVAKNLYALYEYLHHRLVQANIKKDSAMVTEVLNHLKDLKATWEEAIKIAQAEKSRSVDVSDEDDDEDDGEEYEDDEGEDEEDDDDYDYDDED